MKSEKITRPEVAAGPRAFDGYVLERLLGRGGMGEVHLAHDTLLDRPVAIKLIAADAGDPELRRRFLVEARAVARLEHPNVVGVYRVGEVGGAPYLVSEYVAGTPLDRVPRPVSSELALKIGVDLASGLATAHRRGVLHRDIKPANAIVSDDGRVKLLDFGIAKLLEGPSDGARRMSSRAPAPAEPAAVLEETRQLSATGATRQLAETGATRRASGVRPRTPPVEEARTARLDDLTRTGVALGTPRYMAPEVWRGEPATFASDVYSLGALLFVLCAGRPVHAVRTLDELRAAVLEEDAEPLERAAPKIDRRLARIVDRCLRRDPSERFPSAVELRAAFADLLPGARDAIVPDGNPYRGLACFEAEHRNLYFGRDSETRMVLDRLAREGFVIVAGDSGVGKSSLCRAGVIPRLDGWLDEDRRWESVSLVPGSHPVTALAAILAPVLDRDERELAVAIVEDPGGVARSIRARRDRGLLVLVDQLEELVTIADPAEAAAVAELFGWLAVPAPGARLLATVRGDFLGRLAQLPRLGALVTRALFFLRPLSPERIHEAIVGPAAAKGVRFASVDLVEELVASTSAAGDGALPLLQFALAELWEARGDASVISAETLERVGGVGGALCRHADDVIAGMLPQARRAARRVLTSLVSADGTRARRTDRELGDDVAAMGPLVQGRILVARDTPEGTSYEIAHEALIDRWDTLRGWLSSDEEARRARERLTGAADDWERHGRPRDGLLSARRLAEIDRLAVVPAPTQEAFVRASRKHVRRARWSRVGAALALPLVLAVGASAVQVRLAIALDERIDAEIHAAAEAMRETDALAARIELTRREALAAFDAGRDGEPRWADYTALVRSLRQSHALAAQRLESALALDPQREDVRAAFADLLLAQAQLAEAQHETERRDELLARLAVFDDGSRLAAWNAPAEVRFDQPAIVSRYEREGDRLTLVEVARSELLSLPLRLPPGSYLAQAVDDEDLRLPFVAHRGERLELALGTAPPGPEGLVYVPGGRFAIGSEADEVQRRDFFHAVPMHEVTVAPFFIARHETTYAEWIAFLDRLPPEARDAHRPRVGQGGFKGSMELFAGEEGWRLRMQPTTTAFETAIGERIEYVGRPRHVSHDWRRMPVVGITAADGEAYARWLDASGRVPGARLCREREWEYAARGADGRPYPHGFRLEPSDANHDATYDKRAEAMGPDEVGTHPASVSPFGLHDMAGNVWEWTQSSASPTGYAARGGSWYFGPSSSHVADREETEASFRDVSVGLRICADVPHEAKR